MRSIRAELAAALLAAGSAATVALPLGCGQGLRAPLAGEPEAESVPRRGGTLRLASSNDVRNLDPAGPLDGLAMQAVPLLFEGLVDYDAQARLVPALASSYAVDDDGKAVRFVLRAGVTMHDGAELTADDVKRSVERALAPGTPNPVASYYAGLEGFAAFSRGKAPHLDGVRVDGRYDVSFHLTEPDATFLPTLALPAMRPVCRTAGEKWSDAWLPCGAGPFKLEPGGWARGTSLRVVRHEGYFRAGLPHLDAVEWTFGSPPLTQRFHFEAGDVDLLRDAVQADLLRFQADPRWRGLGVALADNIVWGESMNTRVAPFDNVEIRRAVAAAIDREQYVVLRPTNLTPMTQLLPRGVPGYDPTVKGQVHDAAAALEHMRKAGYPYDPATGRGGWPDPVVYTVTERTVGTATAQILQQALARIGIRLELRLVSYPAYLAITQREGASAMSPHGWTGDYPDPSAFVDQLFTTSGISAEGSSNAAFYSSERVDALAARARREQRQEARRALYREIDEILCDEAPWAFVYGQHDFVMRQPYVHGFAAHPVWTFDVRGVWLDSRAPGASAWLGAPLRPATRRAAL